MQPQRSRQSPDPRRPLPRQTGGSRWRPFWPAVWTLLVLLSASPPARAGEKGDQAKPPAPAAASTTVPIGYVKQEVKRLIPLSRLNVEPDDLGAAGAGLD